MHTLPSEISDQSIGTSTLFAAWNAAIYVAQVEDDRLAEVVADGRYLESTREVLREREGLWFFDESYVISRRREGRHDRSFRHEPSQGPRRSERRHRRLYEWLPL